MPNTTNTPPLTEITDLWPFSYARMVEFRSAWIRDRYVNNGVTAIAISAPGTGYTQGDPVTITGPMGAAGAAAYANVDPLTGAITSIEIVTEGSGYDNTTTATAGGTGVGAMLGPVTVEFIRKSAYNLAFNTAFFSDSDVNMLLYDMLVDNQDELVSVYNQRYLEFFCHDGDPTNLADKVAKATTQQLADAAAVSAAEQLTAAYHYLRADCRERMLDDPGFQGSVPDGGRKEFFATWRESIQKDRSWARVRYDAHFRAFSLERA